MKLKFWPYLRRVVNAHLSNFRKRNVLGSKVLARVISVYTGLCLVHIWVESWVVKFWYERSVFTLGGVGYKFGLSLWW